MDALSELIQLLSESDRSEFKGFLKGRNTRDDAKNIRLLDFIETDDIRGVEKLYRSEKNKDAYHALRKRLQDNLLLFLSQKRFEKSNVQGYDALRLLVVGRFLLENDIPKVGFKCLDKAERLAADLEQFNLLNDLLQLKLQYAHLPGAEELDQLTTRFTDNQMLMQRDARLSMAYAFLRQEFMQIHLQGKVVNLTGLIREIIIKYEITEEDLMSYRSIYQILYIANEYAAIQQNYSLIESYIERTDRFIREQTGYKPAYLFYHISILYFLANFHLRRRNFDESKSYLQQMKELMANDNRQHSTFLLRHKLLSALNLFFTNKAHAAISMLQNALSTVKANAKSEDVEDLRVCLVMFLALTNDRASLKQLGLMTRTDAWYEKKMGMLWTIRKSLMEILVHAQFGNIELAMSRLNSFRRRYRKYLVQTSEERVLYYLKLVETYLTKPDVVFDAAYRKKVQAQLEEPANGDIFTMSFIGWLMARWEKKTAYDVVMALV